MKIGDKVRVIDPVCKEYVGEAIGTIVGEHISNSHYAMLAASQMWVVNLGNLGTASFRESDLELV